MQSKACTNMIACHLVDGAGHWVQQEQPAEVSRLLLQFLKDAKNHAKEQVKAS
jgi:pimeloyl-ACP methyl ester carboxylesterase